jgi:hypothetical protein
LGIDRTQFSQHIQARIVYAGSCNTSYRQASEDLERLAELDVCEHQTRRVCDVIGKEHVDERDAAVAAFQKLPLMDRKKAPEGVEAPDVAVVGVDGGRMQILERVGEAVAADDDASEKAAESERGKHWREDKIGVLVAMTSDEHESDPCPKIPEHFVDPTRILELARDFHKSVPSNASSASSKTNDEPKTDATDSAKTYEKQRPKSVEKRMVATRRKWKEFGPMVATAAWQAGFYGSKRKAFLGDGASCNWTLWKDHFSSFVPILDFIHALTYVYSAAMAGRSFADGWPCYVRWIEWVWSGEVAKVIAELATRSAELGEVQSGDSETHPRRVVSEALGYLRNNASRMKYAAYRTAGLPLNSSVVESTVKQFNYRVKGSEKFWTEEGAEAMLQLRADALSDDEPQEAFWRRREESESGLNRNKRTRAKDEATQHAQAA